MKKLILLTVPVVVLAIFIKFVTKAIETENQFSSQGPDFFNPEYKYGLDRVG